MWRPHLSWTWPIKKGRLIPWLSASHGKQTLNLLTPSRIHQPVWLWLRGTVSESFLWLPSSVKPWKVKRKTWTTVCPRCVTHSCVPYASLWVVLGCVHSVDGSSVISASFMKLIIHIWGSFGNRRNDCFFSSALECLATVLKWLHPAISVRFRLITALVPLMTFQTALRFTGRLFVLIGIVIASCFLKMALLNKCNTEISFKHQQRKQICQKAAKHTSWERWRKNWYSRCWAAAGVLVCVAAGWVLTLINYG